MRRFRCKPAQLHVRRGGLWLTFVSSALLLAAAAGAAPPDPAPGDAVVRRADAAPWRGVYCTPASCRPASPWNVAAFGAVVLTMGWLADRRPGASR